MNNYKNWLQLQGLKESSIKDYLADISFFHKEFNEMNQKNLDLFFINKSVSANRYNKLIYSLKKYCQYKELNLTFPQKKKVNKKSALNKGYITYEDFTNDLLRNLTYIFSYDRLSEYELLFKFMFFTGCRAEEVSDIKVEDIDFKNEVIHIKNTKTSMDREIFFINADFENCLKKRCELIKKGNIFPLTYNQIYNAVRNVNQQLNFKYPFTPHSLRRSFAIYCLEKGIDISIIQKLMGHADIKTTMMYVEPSRDIIKNACKQIKEGK